ncbi:MAG: AbrB/MazE/SpoVT family DNA-binding domain-containing protein [Legionella sp.]|uniref:AbrB/MazE/SpoVT family DNA-binding domain-containing protein n=1 Tax=Legionella sp. TaxID=459 RepID=UPI0039E63B66
MLKVKITTVGNSVGITFPKEVLSHLNVEKGDYLYLVETNNGYELSPYDQDFIEQMMLAEQIMKEDRIVLRVLGQGLKSDKNDANSDDNNEVMSKHL